MILRTKKCVSDFFSSWEVLRLISLSLIKKRKSFRIGMKYVTRVSLHQGKSNVLAVLIGNEAVDYTRKKIGDGD